MLKLKSYVSVSNNYVGTVLIIHRDKLCFYITKYIVFLIPFLKFSISFVLNENLQLKSRAKKHVKTIKNYFLNAGTICIKLTEIFNIENKII